MYQILESDAELARQWYESRMVAMSLLVGPPEYASITCRLGFAKHYCEVFNVPLDCSEEFWKWWTRYSLWWGRQESIIRSR